MNIEVYDLDSLRKLVRRLQAENARLKEQLAKADIAYESENIFEEKIENMEEYDPDQGGRILNKYITKEMVNQYFSMFWGRMDIYAKRGKNGGYFPQCNHRWNDRICPKQRGKKQNCEDCDYKEWTKLTPGKVMEHLLGNREEGADVIGIYYSRMEHVCQYRCVMA